MERDNLHFNFRTIDGYNKPFNFVISEREAGKTTALWLDKCYKAFKESGRTTLVIRRLINDITDIYINDTESVINKFIDSPIKFQYKKGNLKEGVVDVFIEEKPFIRVIALSNPMSRIKSLILRNLKYIVFDEFIANTILGEKYLTNEAFKFKELFNTFQRESPDLKCYFLGNPYSHYNPYFVDFEVNTKLLKPDTLIKGKAYVIQCYQIKEELKQLILKRNPLYQFDDTYKKYAFGGEAINDINIKLGELPSSYQLKFVFKMEGKLIGIFQNQYYEDLEERYFVKFVNNVSARRTIYCFDFSELVDKTALLSRDDRSKFTNFKASLRNRTTTFENIECYYLTIELFNFI